MVNIEVPISFQRDHLESTLSDILDGSNSSLNDFDELSRVDSIASCDIKAVIERQFNFDAVTCTGVPVLHCVRLMCSFLLNGVPGHVLPDSKTRVSVKTLALHCISAAVKLFPEAILAKVLPDDMLIGSTSDVRSQLIRDIMLLKDHMDPQIKGATCGIISNFICSAMHASAGEFDTWNKEISQKYNTGEFKLKSLFLKLESNFFKLQNEQFVAPLFFIQNNVLKLFIIFLEKGDKKKLKHLNIKKFYFLHCTKGM